jgi:hypothetical protein
MSNYESQPGVAPARITTFARVRKAVRRGLPLPEHAPVLYEDFFSHTTDHGDHRRAH